MLFLTEHGDCEATVQRNGDEEIIASVSYPIPKYSTEFLGRCVRKRREDWNSTAILDDYIATLIELRSFLAELEEEAEANTPD